MKTMTMMPGWSAFGGQTISAYVGPIKKNERILGHSVCGTVIHHLEDSVS